VPDPLGEAEAGRGQRADRADVDDAGRQRVVELATRESADLRVRAALEEAELAGLRDLLREPDAAGALDAPVHVEDHGRPERNPLLLGVGPLLLEVEARERL